jgi:hypothetical protein
MIYALFNLPYSDPTHLDCSSVLSLFHFKNSFTFVMPIIVVKHQLNCARVLSSMNPFSKL